jgi:ubiquinone/menaquinone biosynthesis C-methylase UbiE
MSTFLYKTVRKIWLNLPVSIRQSAFAQHLRSKALPTPPAAIPSVMVSAVPTMLVDAELALVSPLSQSTGRKLVASLGELDEMLAMLDAAAAISDDELRLGFAKFEMRFPMDLPSDPDSPEYRAVQMKLYEWLHGKPYSVKNEVSSFDVPHLSVKPFPYCTESPTTVGHQLIAVGHVIRTLDLKPGSSILEFGPGWGNTTIALARMGYKVTAVDIEQNFIDLIRSRAAQKGLEIDLLHGDFSLASSLDRQFDAVLFFECFHHCADHHALIEQFERIVAPGGKIVFAAEPITDDLPIPWGLRMDGESLWAIRKNGWLELGFTERYFKSIMNQYGWKLHKSVCSDTPWGVIFTATR